MLLLLGCKRLLWASCWRGVPGLAGTHAALRHHGQGVDPARPPAFRAAIIPALCMWQRRSAPVRLPVSASKTPEGGGRMLCAC